MKHQQSPDDMRNLLLAMGLCALVVVLWQVLFPPPPAPTQPQQTAQGGPMIDGGAQDPFPVQPITRDEAVSRDQLLDIETDRLTGSISRLGGRIDNLFLTDYRVDLEENSPDVELFRPSAAGDGYYAVFSWAAADDSATPGSDVEWYLASNSARTLTPQQPIILEWDNGDDLIFRRTISIDENYLFTVTQSVENRGGDAVALSPRARLQRESLPELENFFILHEGPLAVINGALEEYDYDDLEDEPRLSAQLEDRGVIFENAGAASWVGFTDKYWMTALVPADGGSFTALITRRPGARSAVYRADVVYPTMVVPAGQTVEVTTRLFAGAKEIGTIREYQYLFDGDAEPTNFFGRLHDFFFDSSESRFVDSLDWGWFFFLTKPIAEILFAIKAVVGNMGVAIILLTVLFKILLFPLAYKSFVSMSRLKKLQPEMKKLQDRYKDDRQRMQQELIGLYRKEKVNPAAGCLPILLQIPIFFSLYKVLFITIEMRHAPFFGWIQDLSAPDPTSIFNLFGILPYELPTFLLIGIWPILMGISMWIQQMLNPAPTDPVQQKIFNFLPIIFTFLLGTFASGLVIYWTANNVFTILQQYFIMRREGVDVNILSNIKSQFGLGPKEEKS